MAVSASAGRLLDPASLLDVPALVTAYFTQTPDPRIPAQRVAFGTSGHRGSAFDLAFNEAHILATTQAICLYRAMQGITGPLFIGRDTHALSTPALATAIEVLAANGVETMLDDKDGPTPTPVVSHAILGWNRGRTHGLADGIVITPSHNPPRDGGFKYNAPHGGPASSEATDWIQRTANGLLSKTPSAIRRQPYAVAIKAACMHRHDYLSAYVQDLPAVLDMDAIRSSGLKIGIDPLGGASLPFWQRIVDDFRLTGEIVNAAIDPAFRFMTADWDGQIRMDCSSPYAMAPLIAMRTRFDIAFANDPDADRHGIVCPSAGLMDPNHFLTAAIAYLFRNRPSWPATVAIGKTIVSSSSIDRTARRLGRPLVEVPVGFKWFVDGLHEGTLGFAGEESAGATFLRHNGRVWTTDKDGLILGLLAAEMAARTGHDPGQLYAAEVANDGAPAYQRIDAPATPEQKRILKALTPAQVAATSLAGDPVVATLVTAPGNGEPFGGIKLVTDHGWFAARPSGTENVYKLYAESFRNQAHLEAIQQQAQAALAAVFDQSTREPTPHDA